MTGRSRENYNKNYIDYVHSFAPPTQHFKTCLRAFFVGGLICCIGQFLRMMLELAGLTGDVLAGTVSVGMDSASISNTREGTSVWSQARWAVASVNITGEYSRNR